LSGEEGQSEIERAIDYPVLILHDPEDVVVSYTGTEKLFERVKHPMKRLVSLRNAGHDVIVNALQICLEEVLLWLEEQS
jgi:alpha-beta hydrolase superfamily lysophospholipase